MQKNAAVKLISILLVTILAFLGIFLADWPDPAPSPIPWSPEAIVVLGGGDHRRAEEAIRMAELYPAVPVIITGDNGYMENLVRAALPPARFLSEPHASSTYENAKLTAPMLDARGARRVLIVTNWFHAPRALAVFQKVQANREFAVAFSPKPDPMTRWDAAAQRRERFACAAYLILHGIRCF